MRTVQLTKHKHWRGERFNFILHRFITNFIYALEEFLHAEEVFTDTWRPVKLEEFVKAGRDVMEVNPGTMCPDNEKFRFSRVVPCTWTPRPTCPP